MKTKKGFRLRDICGEHIVVAEGIDNIDFSKEFTEDELVKMLLEEYDVDEATAKEDVKKLIEQWTEAQIIEA